MITVEEILRRDLTTDPPPGMPILNERQAKALKLRLAHPEYSDVRCITEAGYHPKRSAHSVLRCASLNAYRSALAQAGTSPNQDMAQIEAQDPARLRNQMVATLTAAMLSPGVQARDLAYVVQVLDRIVPVPEAAPEIIERADKMSVSTLETLLGECLQRIDRMRTATRPVQVVDSHTVNDIVTVNP